MKKLAGVLTLGLFTFFSFSSQAGVSYNSAQEQMLVNICKAAKSDEVRNLRQAQRASNLSYKQIAKGVVCNGEDVIEYAASHQAYKTAQYISDKAQLGSVIIRDIAKVEHK
ncbi:DUF3718 domain-containing protein [Catenovulum sp. SM1970]|uniref:DUF3718 domain-containing protein n=1 Tax=Marinifaba aquimaris TaxID=2741323 RepID=UPI0015722C1D|nr:DUF3718 domain-containing protein [Marinifaba aquimaris]NTS77985.1 DUF3718 domain-containing protein [Marinifaba aquimaris]